MQINDSNLLGDITNQEIKTPRKKQLTKQEGKTQLLKKHIALEKTQFPSKVAVKLSHLQRPLYNAETVETAPLKKFEHIFNTIFKKEHTVIRDIYTKQYGTTPESMLCNFATALSTDTGSYQTKLMEYIQNMQTALSQPTSTDQKDTQYHRLTAVIEGLIAEAYKTLDTTQDIKKQLNIITALLEVTSGKTFNSLIKKLLQYTDPNIDATPSQFRKKFTAQLVLSHLQQDTTTPLSIKVREIVTTLRNIDPKEDKLELTKLARTYMSSHIGQIKNTILQKIDDCIHDPVDAKVFEKDYKSFLEKKDAVDDRCSRLGIYFDDKDKYESALKTTKISEKDIESFNNNTQRPSLEVATWSRNNANEYGQYLINISNQLDPILYIKDQIPEKIQQATKKFCDQLEKKCSSLLTESTIPNDRIDLIYKKCNSLITLCTTHQTSALELAQIIEGLKKENTTVTEGYEKEILLTKLSDMKTSLEKQEQILTDKEGPDRSTWAITHQKLTAELLTYTTKNDQFKQTQEKLLLQQSVQNTEHKHKNALQYIDKQIQYSLNEKIDTKKIQLGIQKVKELAYSETTEIDIKLRLQWSRMTTIQNTLPNWLSKLS